MVNVCTRYTVLDYVTDHENYTNYFLNIISLIRLMVMVDMIIEYRHGKTYRYLRGPRMKNNTV